jgi:hypothetical protein
MRELLGQGRLGMHRRAPAEEVEWVAVPARAYRRSFPEVQRQVVVPRAKEQGPQAAPPEVEGLSPPPLLGG